jgi:Na+/H+ antiporter NhaD/arsenite permease-like protein
MLWVGGQISSVPLIKSVIIPSFINFLVPLLLISVQVKGDYAKPNHVQIVDGEISSLEKKLIFFTGIFGLVSVPFFKHYTHLPPFMGILLVLGVLWFITELLHKKKSSDFVSKYSVLAILRKIDLQAVLFFLGILLAVGALACAGVLGTLATVLSENIKNLNVLVGLIGIFSAVIDNVPLVAAAIGMFGLEVYPMDHIFWKLLAYCAGTGGSILIIGSAAGIAAMSLEKISFFWYFKKISLYAFLGYMSGLLWFTIANW